jgi:hypothetical protein
VNGLPAGGGIAAQAGGSPTGATGRVHPAAGGGGGDPGSTSPAAATGGMDGVVGDVMGRFGRRVGAGTGGAGGVSPAPTVLEGPVGGT